MDPEAEITQLKQQIQAMQLAYTAFEDRFNSHRHLGTDLTAKIESGSNTVAGADTQVQFNNAGAFGADADFTWLADAGIKLGFSHTTSPFGIYTGNSAIANQPAGGFFVFPGTGNGSGAGGQVWLQAGDGGATGAGGQITISSGSGGGTSGAGGDISIGASSAAAGNSKGGDILLFAGAKSGAGANGLIKLWSNTATFVGAALLDTNSLTADRTFTFPDNDGTLATSSDTTYGGGSNGDLVRHGSSNAIPSSVIDGRLNYNASIGLLTIDGSITNYAFGGTTHYTKTQATTTTSNATPSVSALYATVSGDYGILCELVVRAHRTGGASGSTGDSAGYVVWGTFKNIAGTLSIVGATTKVATHEDQAAWDADLVVSSQNIAVSLTGAANNSILWNITFTTYP